jgi:hypothetical protein
MALTIEDGTGVAGADSYVALSDVRTYAANLGYTVPTADANLEVLVRKAAVYLESMRFRYLGSKIRGSGYLQWPRSGVYIDQFVVDEDVIPQELKNAQCQLAIELQTTDPTATVTGFAVRQKTIGPITTIYAVGDNAGQPTPTMPKVEALLAPLCRSGGSMSVVRA